MFRIIALLGILFTLPLSNSAASERYVYKDKIVEVEGRDFDQIIHNMINTYYEMKDVYSLKTTGLEDRKQLQSMYSQQLSQVSKSILSAGRIHNYAVLYNSLNEMQRSALEELTKETIVRFNSQILYQDGLSGSDVRNAKQLFPKYAERASYEYAYGRELSREELKRFELIRRNTFFENTHHKIDIDIDFLGPIKKVIKALKLKDKFSWVWDQKLHFGYHSEFKHYKKVFVREKGYYKKVKVKLELIRRKVSFWTGPGPWEVYGTGHKYFEEPAAVVGFEVKELSN